MCVCMRMCVCVFEHAELKIKDRSISQMIELMYLKSY